MTKLRLKQIKKTVSLVITSALVAGILTVVPAVGVNQAQAATGPKAEVQNSGSVTKAATDGTNSPPTTVTLTSSDNADGTVNIEATVDNDLSDSGSSADLYKVGSSTVIDSKTSGKVIDFTVNKPTTGYDRYDVKVNDLVSNTITVNSLTTSYRLNLYASKNSYSADDDTPYLTWSNDAKITNSSYALYTFDTTQDTLLSVLYGNDINANSGRINLLREYKGKHEYVTYLADHSATNPTHVSDLTNVQSVSNSVQISSAPWTTSLDISASSYTTDDTTPYVTWTTNQSINKASAYYTLYLIDKTTNTIINNTYRDYNSYTSGRMAISRFSSGSPHEYEGIIASSSVAKSSADASPSDLTDIQATSNIVSTSLASWTTSLTVDKTTFSTSDYDAYQNLTMPKLHWVTNQSINQTSAYEVYLIDKTANQIIHNTSQDYNSYKGDYVTVPRFYNGGPHTYQAIVASSATAHSSTPVTPADLTDIQATSGTVSVGRTPWTVTLGINRTVYSTEDDTPVFSWTTNQTISSNTNYVIYFVDNTTGKVVGDTHSDFNSSTSGTDTAPRDLIGQGHSYQAYIGLWDPNNRPATLAHIQDIQAFSNSVQTARQTWNLSLSAGSTNYNTTVGSPYYNTKQAVVFWNTNQAINNSNSAYQVYVYDRTIGVLVHNTFQDYNSARGGNFSYQVPINQNDQYIAYVALKDSDDHTYASTLKDIQAVSNIALPDSAAGAINAMELRNGSNPSEGNCNQQCYADPVNSLSGEFFENDDDISLSSPITLNFSRAYSSASATANGRMGYGWVDNYDMKVILPSNVASGTSLTDSNQLVTTQENGSTVNFYKSTDGSYFSANRVLANFSYSSADNTFTLTRSTGYKFTFDATSGHLIKVSDRNNNTLTLTYAANGNLIKAEANTGQFLTFGWTDSHITSVTDNAGRVVAYTYDAAGNLTQVQLPDAVNPLKYTYNSHIIMTSTSTTTGVTTNTYDDNNRVIKQVDPLGDETKFSYNSTNGATTTTITLPDGTVNKDYYSTDNQLIKQTQAYGLPEEASTTYTYGSTNQPISITDAVGNVTNYTYDANGNLLTTTDPMGHVTTVTYNNNNDVLTVKDAQGHTATNAYDAKGNLISDTSFGGNTTEYTYNALGLPLTIKAPQQVADNSDKVTSYAYNSYGYVTSVTEPNGGVTSTTLDGLGNPLVTTDPAGNQTTYDYDSLFRNIKVTYPNGSTDETSYKDSGLVKDATNALGNTTSYTYDTLGDVLVSSTETGDVTYTYDKRQNLVEASGYGSDTKTTYDARGRAITATDSNNNVTSRSYLKNDLVATSTDAEGHVTSYTYDADGNMTSTTLPSGAVASATYDSLGQLSSSTSPTNDTQSYEYNADGLTTKTIQTDGTSLQSVYDKNGNILKSIDASGASDLRSYDADGNLISVKDKAGVSETYGYDSSDRNISYTAKDGTVTSSRYNNMDRVSAVSYDNWATTAESYTYNLAGQTLKSIKGSDEVDYKYDKYGNITSRGPPSGNGVKYKYDYSNNTLTDIIYPDGLDIAYSYDNNKNIAGIDDVNTHNGIYHASYTSNNQLDFSVNYTANNPVVTQNTYNVDGNLTSLKTFTPSYDESTDQEVDNVSYKKDFTLDSSGFITKAVTSTDNGNQGQTTNYGYDALKRLSSSTIGSSTKSYGYDAQGNLTSSPQGTSTYNVLGQVQATTQGNISSNFSYDTNGNRTQQIVADSGSTGPTDTEQTSYSYDKDSNLTGVSNSTANIGYAYDADGFLTTRTKTAATGSTTASETKYSWDASGSELLSDGTNDYVYGPGGTLVAQINLATGDITYVITDNKGSVVQLIDDNGNVSATYSYDDYGNTTTQVGDYNHSKTPFGYGGEYQDADTGLYLMGARWYDPKSSSFLTVDPALLATGEAYSYASYNPVMMSDPSGLGAFYDFLRHADDFVYGGWDAVTGGYASKLLNAIAPGTINKCDSAYAWGEVTGTVLSLVAGAGELGVARAAKEIFEASFETVKNSEFIAEIQQFTRIRALDETGSLTPGANIALPLGKRWTVGEAIDKPIQGNPPTWNVMRSRYWKNEAAEARANPGKLTTQQLKRKAAPKITEDTNPWTAQELSRMKRGSAPQRPYPLAPKGIESMELSHEEVPQRHGGTTDVVQRWPKEHAAIDEYRHVNY